MFIKEFSLRPIERKLILCVPNGYLARDVKVESLRENLENKEVWTTEEIYCVLPSNETLTILNQFPKIMHYRVTGNFEKVN